MKIEIEELTKKCLEYGFSLLSKREYCISKFREKLEKKFPELIENKCIENLIKNFREKKYLSDTRFCEFFIQDKINLNNWGRWKIYNSLRQKGICKTKIRENLEIHYSKSRETEIAKIVLKKKFAKKEPNQLDKQKIHQFLYSRGFDKSIINEVVFSI